VFAELRVCFSCVFGRKALKIKMVWNFTKVYRHKYRRQCTDCCLKMRYNSPTCICNLKIFPGHSPRSPGAVLRTGRNFAARPGPARRPPGPARPVRATTKVGPARPVVFAARLVPGRNISGTFPKMFAHRFSLVYFLP
jgi:hypothetical protein